MITNYARTILMLLVAVCLLAIAGLSPVSAAIQASTTTPTATRTATLVPATATKVVTATAAPPTVTKVATATAVPPTATKVATATAVPPTATMPAATATITPTKVATATATKVVPPTATVTRTPTKTPTRPAARAPRVGTVTSLSTYFTLQNMDTSIAANISATFFNITGTAVSTVTRSAVGTSRSVTVDQRAVDGGLNSFPSFQGSVVVSSTTQLASVVSEFSSQNVGTAGQDFRFDMYNGVPSTAAAISIFMPQLLKNINDPSQGKTYNSTIAIQNTSNTTTANVTLVYNELAPVTGTFTRTNILIPPGTSIFIDQATDATLTTEAMFFGSGRITSNVQVAVIVNFNAAGALLAYPGFTDADSATSLYAPFLLKNFYDGTQNFTYGTGIMVMTVDPGPTTVTVTYSLSDGSTVTSTKVANPVINFDQRNDADLAGKASMVASATITTVGGKRVVAMINEVTNNDATRGIRATTYRAMSAGAAKFYVPLLFKNLNDAGQGITYGSGVAGQLLGNVTTTIQIQYIYGPNPGDVVTSSVTLNPAVSRVFVFDARIDPNLSGLATMTASAIVSSTNGQSFVIIANQVSAASATGDTLGSYAGVIGQ